MQGIDCPIYVVDTTYTDIELRTYEPSVWVSTNVTNMNYEQAVSVGFGVSGLGWGGHDASA